MPVYDYKCRKCGHEIECISSIEDDSRNIYVCPRCDYIMTKQLSSPLFVINGYNESNGYSGGKNDI